jgi:hypothetical protein
MTPSDSSANNGPKPESVDGTTPAGDTTQGGGYTVDQSATPHPNGMGAAPGEANPAQTPNDVPKTDGTTAAAAVPAPIPSTTMPSNASSLGQEATQHLRAAQGNLEGFAEQVARGEYGPNGAGEAGRIWRTLAALQDPNHLVDAWGEIMAMSTGLWSVGKLAEAIELVDASARSFPVPDVWKSRVDESLKAAKDYQAAREAENAFQDGRDDEALQYADKISNQSEAEHYRRVLKLRLDRRKKQRRAIFTIAGVAMIGLLVASGIAISTMGRISIAPPTPDFTGFGDALENVSNDLRQQRDVRDGTTGVDGGPSQPTDTPEATTQTPAQPDQAIPDPIQPESDQTDPLGTDNGMPNLDQMLGGGNDAPVVPNPTEQSQTDVAPAEPAGTPTGTNDPVGDILGTQQATGTEANPDPTVAPQQPTTPQPDPIQPQTPSLPETTSGDGDQAAANEAAMGDLRANCILGYGGLSEAQKLVEGAKAGLSAADLQTVESRIGDFTRTLENACAKANLGTTELLRGVADIEPQQLRAIAESILLGEQ